MTKRKKGDRPYGPHPSRWYTADAPGHQQRNGITVNTQTKKILEDQVEKLSDRILRVDGKIINIPHNFSITKHSESDIELWNNGGEYYCRMPLSS